MSTRVRPFALLAAALAACSPLAGAGAPEPMRAAAPAAESVHPFEIGALQGLALRDGGLEFPNDGKTFVAHDPAEVAALLEDAGLPTDKLSLSIQPLIVKAKDAVLLFDTGAGTGWGPGAGHLPQSLAAAAVDPASVTDIFISHAHGDHVGGLVRGGALAFPNATIHISEPEWAFLRGMDAETSSNVGIEDHDAFVAAITPKVVAFAPGAQILPGLVQAVEIKGHTPGHSGYRITSGADSLLYIGDAMHHSVVSTERPDWTIAFDSDPDAAKKSRKELLMRSARTGEHLYAVHFPFPGLGVVAAVGEGYAWAPD